MPTSSTEFGDGVVLQLWADGAGEPLVDEMLTSGSGVFAADVWDVSVEWSSDVTGPATAIFTAIGQPFGNLSGVPTDERVDGVTAFQLELTS